MHIMSTTRRCATSAIYFTVAIPRSYNTIQRTQPGYLRLYAQLTRKVYQCHSSAIWKIIFIANELYD